MKKIFFLSAALLIALNLFSQFNVSGLIKGENDKLLTGATVKIKGTAKGSYTDYYGSYSINDVDAGEYELEISYIGYITSYKKFSISSENISILDIVLATSELDLSEVTVEATRASDNTPIAQTNIEYADIEKNNLGQDLPFLLQNEVSLVSTSDAGAGIGYTGFRLRGSDASRINVTINGIPVNDSESQGVYWVNMPDFASSTENIQIQRGVGTSTNGAGAFGGSVNLQTEQLNEKAYGELSSSYGSFNAQKYTAKFGTGLVNEHWAFDGRASMISSDGYIDRASSDLKSYYLSGGYYAKNTTIKAIHFSGREKTYQSWWGTPQAVVEGDTAGMSAHAMNNWLDSAQTTNLNSSGRTYNYYEYDNEVDKYGQDHFQLHFSQLINDNIKANAALHYTHGAGYYEQYRKADDFSSYGLSDLYVGSDTISSTDLIRRRWLDNDFYGLTYNLLYQNNKLDMVLGGAYNIYDGDHFGEIIWTEYASNSAIRDRYYDNRGEKTDMNVFLKSEYKLSEKLTSFIDLQYRSVDYATAGTDNDLQTLNVDTSFAFFNPKLGLNLEINKKLKLFASVAVANREPVRNDFIDNPINEQPSHENLIDYEIGLDRTSEKLSFQANLYYMSYKDQLILTGQLNDVGSSVRVNVDKSYRAGIELSSSVVLNKKLRLRLNGTFSQNKIDEFNEIIYDYGSGGIVEIKYENSDIAFSPNIISAAAIEYAPLKAMSVLLQTKYVGKQYLDNTSDDSRAIDSYQTIDARVSYSLFPKHIKELSLNFMVNNVLNSLYSSNGYTYSYIYGQMITENFYYPQAGRNFLCGLTIKF